VEQQPQPGSTAIARGQNVVHVLPTDWAAAPSALAPLLDRLDSDAGGVQLMIVVADADAAVGVVNALVRSRGPLSLRAVAATGAARTARILRAGAAPVLVGAPDQLVALLRASALKLEGVRGFAVAWIEDVLASGGGPDLEAVMAELPKDVPRTVITSSVSPAYGRPFLDIFEDAGRDFYQIPLNLHSPAAVHLNNLRTGRTFSAGAINYDVLRESFFN